MSTRIDMSQLKAAMKRLRTERGSTKKEVCEMAARGFVRAIVLVTPPASQKSSGSDAKKAGEKAIESDLRKIFKICSPKQIQDFIDMNNGVSEKHPFGFKGARAIGDVEARVLTLPEMKAWHDDRRRKDGRVMDIHATVTTGLRKMDLKGLDQGLVTAGNFATFLRAMIAFVGELASGWNAAAEKLNVRGIPAWIKRHGNSRGEVVITVTDTMFRIECSNAVKFVGNVRDYDRRIQLAVQYEANAMNRNADFLLRRALKRAGF